MEKKSNGLAIASFVIAISGIIILCFPIYGLLLGIICFIVALILGIIALVKKQTPWAAWIGTILSGLLLIILCVITVISIKFVKNHRESIIDPMVNFSSWMDENPEFNTLMKNKEFQNMFQSVFEQKMNEKYGTGYEDVEGSIDGALTIFSGIFEDIKDTIIDLANQEGETRGLDNNQESL